MSLVIVRVLGLSKTAGLILASNSDGGLSFTRASRATTGRWSECAPPVKVVGGSLFVAISTPKRGLGRKASIMRLSAIIRASDCPPAFAYVVPPFAGYLTSRSQLSTQLKSPPVMA
eukprot:scaffold5447_cov110-Isochrysis_galbana.AAC.1